MGGLKASEMYEAGRSPVPLNDLLGSGGTWQQIQCVNTEYSAIFWHEFGSFCLNSGDILCLFA